MTRRSPSRFARGTKHARRFRCSALWPLGGTDQWRDVCAGHTGEWGGSSSAPPHARAVTPQNAVPLNQTLPISACMPARGLCRARLEVPDEELPPAERQLALRAPVHGLHDRLAGRGRGGGAGSAGRVRGGLPAAAGGGRRVHCREGSVVGEGVDGSETQKDARRVCAVRRDSCRARSHRTARGRRTSSPVRTRRRRGGA